MKRFLFIMMTLLSFSVLNAQNETNDKSLKEVVRVNDKKYLLGETSIDRKQYQEHLKENCMGAYNEYMRAKKKTVGGWIWFGFGAGFLVEGVVCSATDQLETALVGYGASIICSTVSLFKFSKANKLEENSVKIYNDDCVKKKYSDNVHIDAASKGIGLSLTF